MHLLISAKLLETFPIRLFSTTRTRFVQVSVRVPYTVWDRPSCQQIYNHTIIGRRKWISSLLFKSLRLKDSMSLNACITLFRAPFIENAYQGPHSRSVTEISKLPHRAFCTVTPSSYASVCTATALELILRYGAVHFDK